METKKTMAGCILENIADLHLKLYDLVSSMAGTLPDTEFLGFDDSKSRPELPQKAIQLSFDGFEIDRGRTTTDVHEFIGDFESFVYDKEEVLLQTQFIKKRPLPIDLFYELDAWCYDSQTALQIDLAILKTIPERGVLSLTINDQPCDFPIELLDVQNLDDLTANIREKIFRYKVEAWVPSFLNQKTGKIVTTAITDIHESEKENLDSSLLDHSVLKPTD